jgi:septal ring factor EnvC (AmiA/AmiB activator)
MKGMRMIRRFSIPALSFVLCCLATTSCGLVEKMQLQSRIDDLNKQKQSVIETVTRQEADVESLNNQLNLQVAELNEHQAKIHGYMLDHKMAVAALTAGVAGAGVALDHNNSFSDDAKNIGGVVATLAVFYALANLDEISDVVKTLNQADAHSRTLEVAIAQTRAQIDQRSLVLRASQTQQADLTAQIASLQARVGQL